LGALASESPRERERGRRQTARRVRRILPSEHQDSHVAGVARRGSGPEWQTTGGGSTITLVKTLVIDVGGTNVKVCATGRRVPTRIPSGPRMTPAKMVA